MDFRQALAPGTRLMFPGMECTIGEEFGRGSNTIVYKGWYSDLLSSNQSHTVLIKELFPYHPKGFIYRTEDADIACSPEGKALLDYHTKSFKEGNRIHLQMMNRHPEKTGVNLNTFSLNNTYYTVLGFSGGRSLESELSGKSVSLRQTAVRILNLLDALNDFHNEGYLHLDIAPDNILIIGDEKSERVMLIDYNSVTKQTEYSRIPIYAEGKDCTESSGQANVMPVFETGVDGGVSINIKSGFTAPEIRTGNLKEISKASDIYSVTAVFFMCLTGKTLSLSQMIRKAPPDISGTPAMKGMPDPVCKMVKQILSKGLSTIPRKRYQCTNEMTADVNELIRRIDAANKNETAVSRTEPRKKSRVLLLCCGAAAVAAAGIIALFCLRSPEQYAEDIRRTMEDTGEVPRENTQDEALLTENDSFQEYNINIDNAQIHFNSPEDWEINGALPAGVTFKDGEVCLDNASLKYGITSDIETVIRLSGENSIEGAVSSESNIVICGDGSVKIRSGEQSGIFCGNGKVSIEDCQVDIGCEGFGIMIGAPENEEMNEQPFLTVRNADLNVRTESVCLFASNILIEDSDAVLFTSCEDPDFTGYNGVPGDFTNVFVMKNSTLNISHEFEGNCYSSFLGDRVLIEDSHIETRGAVRIQNVTAENCYISIDTGKYEEPEAFSVTEGYFSGCEFCLKNMGGYGIWADGSLTMEKCSVNINTLMDSIVIVRKDLVFDQCDFSIEAGAGTIHALNHNSLYFTGCTGNITGEYGIYYGEASFDGGDLQINGDVAALMCTTKNQVNRDAGIILKSVDEASGLPVNSCIWDGMLFYTFGKDPQYDGAAWTNAAKEVHLCPKTD